MKTAKEVAWKMVLFFKDHGAKFENLANTNDLVAKEFTSFAAAQVELEKVSAAIKCEKVVEERVKEAFPDAFARDQKGYLQARAEGFKEGWQARKEADLKVLSLYDFRGPPHLVYEGRKTLQEIISEIRALTPPKETL